MLIIGGLSTDYEPFILNMPLAYCWVCRYFYIVFRHVGSQLFLPLARRSQDIRKMLNPDSRSLMGKLNSLTLCIFWLQCSLLSTVLYESFFFFFSCFFLIIFCLVYSFFSSFRKTLWPHMFCSVLFWLSKCPILSSWNVFKIMSLEAATWCMCLHRCCSFDYIRKQYLLRWQNFLKSYLELI